MSAHAVTAKSTSWSRVTGHLPGPKYEVFRPKGPAPALRFTKYKPLTRMTAAEGRAAFRSSIRTSYSYAATPAYGPGASRALELKLLKQLARKLSRAAMPLSMVAPLVFDVAPMVWNRYVDPEGFPGWGTFTEGWFNDNSIVWPGKVPGQYSANGFGGVGAWTAVHKNVCNTDDGTPIFGYRYWGRFNANPGASPYGRADNWPDPITQAMPGLRAKLRYNRLPDLAPSLKTETWGPRQNIEFTLGTTERDPLGVRFNVPRVKEKGSKAKPANMFVWSVLKLLANAGGEMKEWIDIFAEASGYIKHSMMLPEHLRGDKYQTRAKTYWLFYVTGINSMDWDRLSMLIVENEIEDFAYGRLGRLSKSAARSLGMTVGPQTGLVM